MSDGIKHVSTFELDVLAISSLSPEQSERIRAHLSTCARCSADLQEASAARDYFQREVLPLRERLLRQPTKPFRFSFRLPPFVFGASLGAIAVVMVSFLMLVRISRRPSGMLEKAAALNPMDTEPDFLLGDPPQGMSEREEAEEKEFHFGGVGGDGIVGAPSGGVVRAPDVVEAKPSPPRRKVVPSFTLDQQRISSPEPSLPPNIGSKGQRLIGTYRICVDQDGHISDITVITPISGADSSIIDQLKRTWVFKPQLQPICGAKTFLFVVR